jgi:hypothetical protein
MNPLLNPLTSTQRLALSLGTADEGYTVFDTTLNNIYFWDGFAWITSSGTVVWGSITGTLTAQTDLTAYLAANYYPLSSNPAGYIDLTDLSGGTGISYNNLTGVITNSAPDQTVVLNNGTGISTSGTYPNFTITNTSPDQIVSLGTTGSGLSVTGTYPSFTLQNTLPDQTVALTAGTGIGITGTYPNFTITNSSPSSGGTVTSIATSAPITGGTITSTGTIGITQASTTTDGYLSSIDWTAFNSKVGGSGTTNYLPKWNSLGTGLVDSQIRDDGSSTGIGSIDNAFKFTVNSTTFDTVVKVSATKTLGGGTTAGTFQSLGNGTGPNRGLMVTSANNTNYNVGIHVVASTTAPYALWLQDGTEGIGKVLTSTTSDGKAQWVTPATPSVGFEMNFLLMGA